MKPIEVFLFTSLDGKGNDFGDVVGMVVFHVFDQSWEGFFFCFENH